MTVGSERATEAVPDAFFTTPEWRAIGGADFEWFTPTDHTRGPWDAESCHAGPPTGLMVRAMEQVLRGMSLVRITVDLARPIPMAGFRIEADVTRRGRTVGATSAALVDGDGVTRVTAVGLHITPAERPLFDHPSTTRGTSRLVWPRPSPVRSRWSAPCPTVALALMARPCVCGTHRVSPPAPDRLRLG